MVYRIQNIRSMFAYINGNKIGEVYKEIVESEGSHRGELVIGNWYDNPKYGPRHANVEVDELFIWNRELSAEEITVLIDMGDGT